MERLPLSQPFTPMPLNSPTMESPRAGLPAPLLMPNLMHSGVPPLIPTPKSASMGRPGSTSSLSSIHTPPPYETGLMYSPTGGVQTTSMLPAAGASSGGHSPRESVAASPGQPVGPPTTISTGSSTENSSVVTSPREPGTSSPGACSYKFIVIVAISGQYTLPDTRIQACTYAYSLVMTH